MEKQNSDYRYRAFISYSRVDATAAAALHRALERLRIPFGLKDSSGAKARRLRPIFRDVDELAASSSLGAALEENLRSSEFLIVLCSPGSAASEWVNREIEYFLSLGRHDRVLAVLVDGVPEAWSEAQPDGAFAPALMVLGQLPLAAEYRGDGRARRRAVTMVAAALLGVGAEALLQRFRRRRLIAYALSVVVLIAAGSVAGLVWRDAGLREARAALLRSPGLLSAGLIADALQQATLAYRTLGTEQDADTNLRTIILAAGASTSTIELLTAGQGWYLQQAQFARDGKSVGLCWGHYDEATGQQFRIDIAGMDGVTTIGAAGEDAQAKLPDGTHLEYGYAVDCDAVVSAARLSELAALADGGSYGTPIWLEAGGRAALFEEKAIVVVDSQTEEVVSRVGRPIGNSEQAQATASLVSADGRYLLVGGDSGRLEVYLIGDTLDLAGTMSAWSSGARIAFLSEAEPGYFIAASDGGERQLAKFRIGRIHSGETFLGAPWSSVLTEPGSTSGATGLADGGFLVVDTAITFDGDEAVFHPSLSQSRLGARPGLYRNAAAGQGYAISPGVGILMTEENSVAISAVGSGISAPAEVRNCDGGEIDSVGTYPWRYLERVIVALDMPCIPAGLRLHLLDGPGDALVSAAATPDRQHLALLAMYADERYAVLISSQGDDQIQRIPVARPTGEAKFNRLLFPRKDLFIVVTRGFSALNYVYSARYFDGGEGGFTARAESVPADIIGTDDEATAGQQVGTRIYTRGQGTLVATDIETVKAVATLALDFGECYGPIAVSPSQKLAVAGGSSGELCIFDLTTQRKLAATRVGNEQAEAVGWLEDERLIGVVGHGVMQAFDVGLLISDPAAAADRALAEFLAGRHVN